MSYGRQRAFTLLELMLSTMIMMTVFGVSLRIWSASEDRRWHTVTSLDQQFHASQFQRHFTRDMMSARALTIEGENAWSVQRGDGSRVEYALEKSSLRRTAGEETGLVAQNVSALRVGPTANGASVDFTMNYTNGITTKRYEQSFFAASRIPGFEVTSP